MLTPASPPPLLVSYCLSGLASAQQHSGRVLGPESNRLATADPLCNVVADKLAAAVAHFSSGIGSCSLF